MARSSRFAFFIALVLAVQAPTSYASDVTSGSEAGGNESDGVSSSRGTPIPPPARVFHSGAYDPVRRQLIVFGGVDPTLRNDVLALSLKEHTEWVRLDVAGEAPAPRGHAAMIYDPVRRRMIVYGGSDRPGESGGSLFGDVWELSLKGRRPSWRRIIPSGTAPAPRRGATAIYDPVGDRMVIYGGLVGALEWSGETWALSLDGDGTWTRIDAPGTAPTPRWLHTAVYDAARNRMIVFGGNSATRVWNNDVYTLSLGDSPVWTQITAVGGDGPLVSKHAAIYDPVRDRMVVYGGENRIFFSGLWSLSLSGDPVWTELVLDPQPPGRWGEVGIYDPRQDRFVIHGGFGILSDCWSLSLDPPGWSLIDASSGAAALEEGSPAEALASAAPHTQLSVWIEPNPFTRSARNELTLPRASVVRASVQDAQGRQVRELARRELPAGPHTLEWDGRDSAGRSLPMGAYFVCVRAGDDRIVRRTILVP